MKTGLLLCLSSVCALAGPPFQTDDPQPVDFRHYEFYTFATSDGTRVETDTAEPALEFNRGSLPNVHFHIIVPAAAIFPSDNPNLAPAGVGRGHSASAIQNSASNTDLSRREKASEDRTPRHVRDALRQCGAGETIVRVPGYRSYPFAGALLQRDLGKKWTLGGEVFYHQREGIATAQTRPATTLE